MKKLATACVELVDALNIIGCVNFEFIQDRDNNYHFVECNPKFSSGVEYSRIAAYNGITNHIRAFEGSPLINSILSGDLYCKKFEEYVTKKTNRRLLGNTELNAF